MKKSPQIRQETVGKVAAAVVAAVAALAAMAIIQWNYRLNI